MEKLSFELASSLIKSKQGIKDLSYWDKFNVSIFKLNDGTVVAEDHDHYSFFDSIDELNSILNNHRQSSDILEDLNSYDRDFPKHTASLIRNLFSELGWDNTMKDEKSLAVLKQLDPLIVQKELSWKKKFFIHMLALTGEVLKNDFPLHWKMDLSRVDKKTWHPNLSHKGNTIGLSAYFYEAIFEVESLSDPLYTSYQTVQGIIVLNLK